MATIEGDTSNGHIREEMSLTARIARWSSHHRWTVVAGWFVIVVGAIFAGSAVGTDTDIEQEAPGEAGRAADLFDERFGPAEDSAREVVVFAHPTLQVTAPEYQQKVEDLIGELRALRTSETRREGDTAVTSSKRVVAATLTSYDVGVPREQSPFVATNGSAGDVSFAIVTLVGDPIEAEQTVASVVNTVDEAAGTDDFDVSVGGEASIFQEQGEVIEEDLAFALLLNLPITLLLLLLAFRALVAAFISLGLGLIAIMTASGILAFVSQAYPLSEIYAEMVLLMGLATGIDYSLFIMTRYRGERTDGHSVDEAITLASGTSGKAVVFAGVTVLLAISGMFLVGDVTFTSLALSAVVVVAIAVIVSVTLLPALLAILGDHIDRGRLGFLRPKRAEGGGIWGRISDYVLARPVTITIVTLVALLLLASPLLTLNLGFNGQEALPDAVEAKHALNALEENFTLGLTSPAIVVVDAGPDGNIFGADVQAGSDELLRAVQAETSTPENPEAPYGSPIQTEINDSGTTAVLRIPINADTGEDVAIEAVEHLRDDLIPQAFDEATPQVLVTGATAANIDFRENILAKTPLVVAFVVTLTFLTLLVAFRSIVIPIKAVILNALSVGAAYGILVLVFQEGFLLEGVLDFEATGIVESWLPLFLFSILFGLSMDYHMFVMGRIKEAHEHGASTDDAISTGIKATAGTITSAAAVMIAVALIFAFTRNIGLKQFGFGLATAIFIDATVIRSVLLPASMKLLGPANWYLPSWLQWLPEIRMEEGSVERPITNATQGPAP
ncbi:MAG TPA: MMPL family transporter [Ilumatobacter sp.]